MVALRVGTACRMCCGKGWIPAPPVADALPTLYPGPQRSPCSYPDRPPIATTSSSEGRRRRLSTISQRGYLAFELLLHVSARRRRVDSAPRYCSARDPTIGRQDFANPNDWQSIHPHPSEHVLNKLQETRAPGIEIATHTASR